MRELENEGIRVDESKYKKNVNSLVGAIREQFSRLYGQIFKKIYATPMDESHTPNALIRFIYREMPAIDAIFYAQTIQEDAYLRHTHAELSAAKQHLPKVEFAPGAGIINNILRYSRETAFEAHC